jgi:hypothetical protein
MPNLDFYAIGTDLDVVIDVAFAQTGCRIFESYSRPDHDIIEFTSADQLRAKLSPEPIPGSAHQLTLQIVVPEGPFEIRRFAVNPDVCDGHAFRHSIEGWGLIQFYLGGSGIHGVINSHTNHNSMARARAWEPVHADLRPVDQWDWKAVGSVSSRINRMIHKLAVGKIGGRPVLPAAAAIIAAGTPPIGFGPSPPPFQPL